MEKFGKGIFGKGFNFKAEVTNDIVLFANQRQYLFLFIKISIDA